MDFLPAADFLPLEDFLLGPAELDGRELVAALQDFVSIVSIFRDILRS